MIDHGEPAHRAGLGELRLARSDYAGREWTFACGREAGIRLTVGGESVAAIASDKLRAAVDFERAPVIAAEELLDALQVLAKQRRCPVPDEIAEPIFAVVRVRLEALEEIRTNVPLGGPTPAVLDDVAIGDVDAFGAPLPPSAPASSTDDALRRAREIITGRRKLPRTPRLRPPEPPADE